MNDKQINELMIELKEQTREMMACTRQMIASNNYALRVLTQLCRIEKLLEGEE